MQKLSDHTAALEGRMSTVGPQSTVEDDMAPLKCEVRHVQSLTAIHSQDWKIWEIG